MAVRQNSGREHRIATTVRDMKRTMAAVAALPLLAIFAACGGGDDSATATATATVTTTVTATPEADPSDESIADALGNPELEAGFFNLSTKVKSKECFGSAGCLLEVEIVPKVLDLSMLEGYSTIELTYELKGGEDGPIVGTMEFDGEGSYTPQEEMLTIPTSTTKVTVTPTDVTTY